MINPKRGEIWLVDLNPTRGQEIQKTRPVIIISTDIFQKIPLRIIIPITTWQDKFNSRPFMIKLVANAQNKLNQDSSANVLQVRSISLERFIKKVGHISDDKLEAILVLLLICVEYKA
ncbi:type II toxin-antitoxin system PemK/MazF family toxin [Spirulina subsalsa FACHB-351]|uniref:mRNA interferase n=1 Tax=Spirulina subsalsa FACHB-351 TaxID=234711 RepID=A0ABT3L459_9CYAN|nr:type II toxin-antitoxin system PemK/MazF family toxin [Spirulina subsalsa]MCW6036293.1 type II toxin-antitoxin system PemK/MazF family toxin [Spirulina subsalsa FACHB-351]